ncbi:MAG: DEAD/DEAH box helicase [Sulfurihydrogenibium sp.]|nr:MAG: DEAD/DEAH box helicase [Sulfurihydrogenibium sp.]
MEIIYRKVLEPVESVYGDYDFKCKKIKDFLKESGIRLYLHQAEGIKAVLEGKDIVVTTPTASGKSMIYTLSILETICQNPNTRAILIFPLVALARDQAEKIENFIQKAGLKATVKTYYGSTDKEERYKIRNNPPNFLITTPDMLSKGILPYHSFWQDLFYNLKFVVIDELHSYRGVLGSHVSNVIKRLNRIADHYTGELPQYICNSATIKNPKAFAEKFVGKEFVEINKSGSPSPRKYIYITKPVSNEALIKLIKDHIERDIPTIVFIDSRKDVELLYKNIKLSFQKENKEELSKKVSPYRSGYNPEFREEIEKKMANGELKVLISTSALEMGIDIGNIDSVIVRGFPGTLASLWQRFGRAGRRNRDSINYFIPKNDVLDQFYVKNPEDLFNRSVEEPVINPNNKYILKNHVLVAAKELPLELKNLSSPEKEAVKELLEEGKLRFNNGKFYIKSKSINTDFNIRSTGDLYEIIDVKTQTTIGEMNQEYAFYEAFEKAVYIHGGVTYKVLGKNDEEKVIYVEESNLNYFTEPILQTEINIIKEEKQGSYKDIKLYYGEVNVRSLIVGYSTFDIEKHKKIKDVKFEKPLERNFITKGMWFTLENYYENLVMERTKKEKLSIFLREIQKLVDVGNYNLIKTILNKAKNQWQAVSSILNSFNVESLPKDKGRVLEDLKETFKNRDDIFIGSIHGLEHGMIGIFSIFAMNDRWDIGGVSTNYHPQTEKATIFIYDGIEGGIGYAEVGYERLEDILKATYKNVKNCKCLNGCPSCILSPKCGNANEYLDKQGTQVLLELLLA